MVLYAIVQKGICLIMTALDVNGSRLNAAKYATEDEEEESTSICLTMPAPIYASWLDASKCAIVHIIS